MAEPVSIVPGQGRASPAHDSVPFYLETLRRLLVILALALWFGGFTFYSLVVIHTGHRVFGSRVEVGFLTQQVTRWLNLISLPTVLLLLWNVFAGWRSQRPMLRAALVCSWAIISAIQLALFALHPALDRLLDAQTRTILQREQFETLHLIYLDLSTAQWVATIIYAWASVSAWRVVDRLSFYQ